MEGWDELNDAWERIGSGCVEMWQGFVDTILGLLGGLLDGFEEMFAGILTSQDGFIGEWATKIDTWWNENVSPWFTRAKWEELANNIKETITVHTTIGQFFTKWKTMVFIWITTSFQNRAYPLIRN